MIKTLQFSVYFCFALIVFFVLFVCGRLFFDMTMYAFAQSLTSASEQKDYFDDNGEYKQVLPDKTGSHVNIFEMSVKGYDVIEYQGTQMIVTTYVPIFNYENTQIIDLPVITATSTELSSVSS